jgi:hypothetical protein
LRRATSALLIVVAMVMAAAAVLAVSKGWLVVLGLRGGVAEYNARANSRLMVHGVGLDLLIHTAAVHRVSITDRGQSPLEASIDVKHATA